MSAGQLRHALELALRQAQMRVDEQELQQFVFGHCDGLDPARRSALEREYYVP